MLDLLENSGAIGEHAKEIAECVAAVGVTITEDAIKELLKNPESARAVQEMAENKTWDKYAEKGVKTFCLILECAGTAGISIGPLEPLKKACTVGELLAKGVTCGSTYRACLLGIDATKGIDNECADWNPGAEPCAGWDLATDDQIISACKNTVWDKHLSGIKEVACLHKCIVATKKVRDSLTQEICKQRQRQKLNLQ